MTAQTQAFDEGTPLARALSDAAQLAGRLHRLTIALALSEQEMAEAIDKVADVAGGEGDALRRRAQAARAVAATCHEFDARLRDTYQWASR